MENLNVQSLTLMLLVTMVYTASLFSKKTTQLDQIDEEAGKLLKNPTLHNISVPKIPRDENNTLCVPRCFCYAEKSLHNVSSNSTKHLYKLLKNFNRDHGNHCSPNTAEQYPLSDLLKDIHTCVQYQLSVLSKHTG